MSINELQWNQADISNCLDQMNQGMIALIAFNSNKRPKIIGTAYIVAAYKSYALAITAAHNFAGIRSAQTPNSNHHFSALPEFLGDMQSINLDRTRVRAICHDSKGTEVAPISWAAWDKKSDIGIFLITTQDCGNNFFNSFFSISSPSLSVGDEVALLGYADMQLKEKSRNTKGIQRFIMQKQLLFRSGKITKLHTDGHILCRGKCIETSIPVFSGMSGGPVFKMDNSGKPIMPFGVISSDQEADVSIKNNLTKAGASIIALLDSKVNTINKGVRKFSLDLNSPYIQKQ